MNSLKKLFEKKSLSREEAKEILVRIFNGEYTQVQISAILIALKMRGETVDEILGFIDAMREKMIKVKAPNAIDMCGTGGDGQNTFNISTCSAFVVAGAGVKVAKHGNRAASSKCGSADVLEALGVKIVLTKEEAEKIFAETGMVFLFAPIFHSAMKSVATIRKELKTRTIFNFLGPFTNPAGTKRQVIGVPNLEIASLLSKVARELNYEKLLIVTSETDEISINEKTTVFEIAGKKVKKYLIDPLKFGIKKTSKNALLGGSSEENAKIILSILGGEKGPRRDAVIINSAAAIYVSGLAKNLNEGLKMAGASIDEGRALKVLQSYLSLEIIPLIKT